MLVGSNGFNLAAMIGLSALVTGRVRLARETLLFEGTVGLIITLLAAALLLRWLSPGGAAIPSALTLSRIWPSWSPDPGSAATI